MNPLLDFSGLPRFSELKPEHVTPAMDELLAGGRKVVAEAAGAPPTWEAFVAPLEDANERIGRAWGQVAHLHAVLDSPPLREAYNANLPKLSQYWTELGQNERLFANYKALFASPEFQTLSGARKRIVENALRDFRLSGAELAPEKKKRYGEIQEELSRLAAKFSENVLDATNAYELLITGRERLTGLPDDEMNAAREAAEKEGKAGWKFTLQAPSYAPLLQYAADRSLREEVFRAAVTRASELGKPEWDNTGPIATIVALRKEQAALLGYRNYAEVSLVPKMAESPAQVLAFLDELAAKARPHAERDAAELREFAKRELSLDTVEAWDLAFASEKLRQSRYAFSDQEVKQYFPEDAVVKGLFRLVETLYGIGIRAAEAPVWHKDARFYEVRDPSGSLVGQFYFDLYSRDTKRGGAWMDDAIGRRRKGTHLQTPVTYLTCNFQRPVGGKPALFTHDDVLTLFHEFGHGLHHLLTRVDELGVSGLSGVEWDAVELPSQFMENFGWEWEVVRHLSRHVDTGEPLPRPLFDKMLAAKNFQSGLGMLRQIEFAVFDMRLYSDFDPAAGRSALDLLREVRERIAVLKRPAYDRFPNSFGHIFGGGYAAGYYSYKWAEVLSADAYSSFEEMRESKGVLDADTGRRFRDEILAVGGSRPAAESFRAFRGREPRVEALLRHSGMISG
jgi:oligopeptidase A